MINKVHIFPSIVILLNLGAMTIYAFDGDIRKTLYWLAAATLNIVVTF